MERVIRTMSWKWRQFHNLTHWHLSFIGSLHSLHFTDINSDDSLALSPTDAAAILKPSSPVIKIIIAGKKKRLESFQIVTLNGFHFSISCVFRFHIATQLCLY